MPGQKIVQNVPKDPRETQFVPPSAGSVTHMQDSVLHAVPVAQGVPLQSASVHVMTPVHVQLEESQV
jgi:hypothetical protein